MRCYLKKKEEVKTIFDRGGGPQATKGDQGEGGGDRGGNWGVDGVVSLDAARGDQQTKIIRCYLKKKEEVETPWQLTIDIVCENALLEKYYRAQNFCSDEDVDKMLQVFKTDLPASLKITGIGAQSAALLRIIEGGYFAELTEMLASEDEVVVPTHLPWYPDKLAWQLNVTRKDIQRQESGTSEKFVQADAPVSFPDTTDVHDVKDDPHPEAVQDWF